MFSLLLKYQLLHFLRYFKTRQVAKLITVALFLLVFGAVAFGIFLFFREGLYYIGGDIYFKEALNLYLYEMYLLIVLYLVILSTFITVIFSLFRDSDQVLLLASPHYRLLPLNVLVRSISSALWPLFIIVIPALLAMRTVFGLSYASIILSILIVALVIALVVAKVIIGIIFLGKALEWLSRPLRLKTLKLEWLIFLMIIIVGLVFWFTWQTAVNVDIVELFRARDLDSLAIPASVIAEQFRFLPSHLAAYSIFSLVHKGGAGMARVILELLGYLVLISGLWLWFNRLFLSLWQELQAGNYEAGRDLSKSRLRLLLKPRFKGSQLRAIFTKEAVVQVRNLKNLLWFGFLFFIWLMQAALNTVLSNNIAKHDLAIESAPMLTQVLQFATAIFFISAFVLRFAYPAFSAERRTAWILASAPVNWPKVFYAKTLFYVLAFSVIGLAVNYFSVSPISLPAQFIGLSFALYLTSIIFISVFGLALGALFPNFETDDPSVLSTALPGLGFILGSLAYGALGTWLLYKVIAGGSSAPIIIFILLSLIGLAALIRVASQALGKIDFIKATY